MRFTKMHGIGNDYVYVDGFHTRVADPRKLAVDISHRHFGVGADGLIVVEPGEAAPVKMRMFNADGSESEMCGNGIRCLAKFAYEHGLCGDNPMRVETPAGVMTLEMELLDNKVRSVRVDMGHPRLAPADIPAVAADGSLAQIVGYPMTLDGQAYAMTCVSMGNPHAVFFVEDMDELDELDDFELTRLGRKVELHPMFPKRVNVHFAAVNSPSQVTMKTWERGSGITLACGTGAAAVCVAGVLNRLTGRRVLVHLPGGDLELEWPSPESSVIMIGPAAEVFTGDWPDDRL